MMIQFSRPTLFCVGDEASATKRRGRIVAVKMRLMQFLRQRWSVSDKASRLNCRCPNASDAFLRRRWSVSDETSRPNCRCLNASYFLRQRWGVAAELSLSKCVWRSFCVSEKASRPNCRCPNASDAVFASTMRRRCRIVAVQMRLTQFLRQWWSVAAELSLSKLRSVRRPKCRVKMPFTYIPAYRSKPS
jgi:hypothetical protein